MNITLAADLPEVREHMVNVAQRLTSASLSPNAARAVFEARGEIITAPAEKGDARTITNTPKVMERSPAWASDGKSIAYLPMSPANMRCTSHLRTAKARW